MQQTLRKLMSPDDMLETFNEQAVPIEHWITVSGDGHVTGQG